MLIRRNIIAKSLIAILLAGAVATAAIPANAATRTAFAAVVSGNLSINADGTFALSANAVSTLNGLVLAGYTANGVFTSATTDTLNETLGLRKDSVTFICNQSLQPTLQSVKPNLFLGTDSSTIVGGTGRYSGASGAATGYTFVDLNSNTFVKYINGTISY